MKLAKKLSAFISFIIIAVLAVTLTGCSLVKNGDSEKNESETKAQVSMAGKYEVIEMTMGDETVSKEELDALKTLGYTVTIELNDNGTGSIESYGVKEDITYDDNSMTAAGQKMSYTREGSKITLEQEDTKMVFEKVQE